MEITEAQIQKLINTFEANKEDLKEIRIAINRGEYDSDVSISETFEQGYNNALEYVFDTLGIEVSKRFL